MFPSLFLAYPNFNSRQRASKATNIQLHEKNARLVCIINEPDFREVILGSKHLCPSVIF